MRSLYERLRRRLLVRWYEYQIGVCLKYLQITPEEWERKERDRKANSAECSVCLGPANPDTDTNAGAGTRIVCRCCDPDAMVGAV